MKNKKEEVLDYVRADGLMIYDPETGDITWKETNSTRLLEGSQACIQNSQGYLKVTIDKRDYLAHRVAWLLIYQVWPTEVIHHINGNRQDNSIANLEMMPASDHISHHAVKRKRNLDGTFCKNTDLPEEA